MLGAFLKLLIASALCFQSRRAAVRSPGRAPAASRPPLAADSRVPLAELLSTCVDACRRGTAEIRAVQARRDGGEAGADDVAYKIAGDPRSALTAADLAAQAAIVGALEDAWPGLRIVGEEDAAREAGAAARADPLRRDLCASLPATAAAASAALGDITVFVDPLDGTREFVEGRLGAVQTLVGVAVRGRAVAGAVGAHPHISPRRLGDEADEARSSPRSPPQVGLPFGASDDATAAAGGAPVVFGLVGGGLGAHGAARATERDAPARARPLLVAGDTDGDATLDALCATGGGRALRFARGSS